MELTDGTLLGGRVHYRQPATGYRTGIEPILLAASIPAKPGDRVLEAGCGAGAGLLCLLARLPGVHGTGVERDPAMADLARHNAAANTMALDIVTGTIEALTVPTPFDHAFANPPWHDAASTPSPTKAWAKRAEGDVLTRWWAALARSVRHRGTVTLLIPAAQFGRGAAAARAARLGGLTLMPLWPRAGVAAKLVLIRATVGSRAADRIEPGLMLHDGAGFTAAAEQMLRWS